MSGKLALKATTRCALIVEGTHEVAFVEALCQAKEIGTAGLQVLPIGGKTLLDASLKAFVADPRFTELRAIGIVRDADSNAGDEVGSDSPSAAFRAFVSVADSIAHATGLERPTKHVEFVGNAPRVGVFIMPDGVRDGAMESLFHESAAATPVAECVDAFFRFAKNASEKPVRLPKAWTHAYIALQDDPDCHIGTSAQRGYWNLNSPVFDDFAEFVERLVSFDAIDG